MSPSSTLSVTDFDPAASLPDLALQRSPLHPAPTLRSLAPMVHSVVRTMSSELQSAQAGVAVIGDVGATVDAGPLTHLVRQMLRAAVANRRSGVGSAIIVGLTTSGSDPGAARIAVTHTGRSLTQTDRRRVFSDGPTSGDDTSTVSRALADVLNIARRHGGDLEILTAPTAGFAVTLR